MKELDVVIEFRCGHRKFYHLERSDDAVCKKATDYNCPECNGLEGDQYEFEGF